MSLRPALRPALALAFPLFARSSSTSAPGAANCTRWLVRQPSPMAVRECPTPLVLLRNPGLASTLGLSSSQLPQDTEEPWTQWADMFAGRGYTTVEVDVSVDGTTGKAGVEENGGPNGAAGLVSFPPPIAAAKGTLNAQLRLLGIPFMPVIIASGVSCLTVEAYVSDHGASGLVLVMPPPDEDPRGAKARESGVAWPHFTFEPRFPILVVVREGDEEAIVRSSRLGKAAEEGVRRGGKGVEVIVDKDGPRGEKTRMEVERWMDRCGF